MTKVLSVNIHLKFGFFSMKNIILLKGNVQPGWILHIISQWKKIVLVLSDMKFCFFKRLASAVEEDTTSFVHGIHVIGDIIQSSTVPYLRKQIFPGQNSNLLSGRVRARTPITLECKSRYDRGGRLGWWPSKPIERPISCVLVLYDAR
jgi:hypothetical protein